MTDQQPLHDRRLIHRATIDQPTWTRAWRHATNNGQNAPTNHPGAQVGTCTCGGPLVPVNPPELDPDPELHPGLTPRLRWFIATCTTCGTDVTRHEPTTPTIGYGTGARP